jgi:hypothetical protein
MLTLDETTLFYYSLYSSATGAKNPTTAVEEWKTGVKPDYAPRSKPSSRAPSKPGSRANYAASSSKVPSLTAASTTSRSTSRSILTKDVLINQAHQKSKEDRSISQLGGVSDDDEVNGEERLAAASSPFKEKIRLTSSVSRLTFGKFPVDFTRTAVQNIVKIENSPKRPPAPVRKKGSKWALEHLPIGCQDDNRFRKVFLPTWYKFCGQQDDPFAIPDAVAKDAMQEIWDRSYKKYLPPHKITVDGPVFGVVSIRFLQPCDNADDFSL